MKKILLLLFAMTLTFASCSKDDNEPKENPIEKRIKEIASVLNGKFVSTVNEFSGTRTYEILFSPYSSPKEMEFTIPGEYVNIDMKVKVYGECNITEYYNNHLSQTDQDWRYIINIEYEGAQPKLWFYPIGVYGRYETHDITIIDKTSFILDDIEYTKQ